MKRRRREREKKRERRRRRRERERERERDDDDEDDYGINMTADTAAAAASGSLIALIGDEDTVTGFLLAGAGHKDFRQNTNFLIVDSKTTTKMIETTFLGFTQREDVAIIVIAQNVANEIRHLIERYDKAIPAILEIPAKDTPYDPSQDTMMTRVKTLLGMQ